MVVMRLVTVAYICHASIASYESALPVTQLARPLTFWMLTGAEILLLSAVGFSVSQQGAGEGRGCHVWQAHAPHRLAARA